MHPDLKRPSLVDKQPMFTDISHFEDYPEFQEIRDAMLRLVKKFCSVDHTICVLFTENNNTLFGCIFCSTEEGIKKIIVPRNKDNTTASSQLFDLSPDITIKYFWKKVRNKQVC